MVKSKFTNANSIPKVIYITHKTTIPDYVVNNWKKLNPEYTVKYYSDEDCIQFFKQYYPKSYLDYFNMLGQNKNGGPIKSDFWRCCILYKFGGVYVDADIEPLVPIRDFLEKDVDFLTCNNKTQHALNPHIIISQKNEYILKECIDIYTTKFTEKFDYWNHSITMIMFNVVNNLIPNFKNNREGIYKVKNKKYQFILEIHNTNKLSDVYCIYKNKKILNNRYQNYDSVNHTY